MLSLALIVDASTRQMLGEVEIIRDFGALEGPIEDALVIDSQGFTKVMHPVLMAEVNRNGKSDIAMQPLFQTLDVPEIKIKVSSYFCVKSESLSIMYNKLIEIHRANLAGLVLAQSVPEFKNSGLKVS